MGIIKNERCKNNKFLKNIFEFSDDQNPMMQRKRFTMI